MKKVLYTALLVAGLVTTTWGQDKGPSATSKITKLMVETNEYLALTAAEKTNLEKLLQLKYEYLANLTDASERAQYLIGFKEKLNSVFDHEQLAKLAKNKSLYTKLTSE